MTSSCAKRCAATLSSTTSSAYIQRYAIFLRLPLSGRVACNHVSTKAGQDPPPVRAFYLAIAGGGGPVNLVLLGHTRPDLSHFVGTCNEECFAFDRDGARANGGSVCVRSSHTHR